MAKMFNRAKMSVTSTGTGTLTLGGATFGYQTFAQAGVANGDVVSYTIEDGANFEFGTGTYTSSGTTLSRTVTQSYNGTTYDTSPISVTTNAQVFVTALAADLTSTDNITSGTLPVARGGTGLTSLTSSYIPFGNGTGAFSSSPNLYWINPRLYVVGASQVSNSLNWNFSNVDIIRNASNVASPRFISFMLDGDSNSSTTIGGYNAIWGTYDSTPTTGSTSSALNGGMIYGAFASHRWHINGSERMRITSTGTVNIVGAGTAGSTQAVSLNGSAPINSMVLDAGGSLGIGTATPASRLDVQHSGSQIAKFTATTGTASAYLTLNNTGGDFHIARENSTGGTFGLTAYSAVLWASGAYPLIAAVNGGERARISSDGTFRVKGAGTAGSTDAFLVDGAAPASAARIDSSGNLLVGTTTSQGRFTVKSAAASGSAYVVSFGSSTTDNIVTLRDDGLFGTGTATNSPYNYTTASAANLFVNSGGNFQRSTSSIRYKTDVQNATHGLSDVLNLRPVTYKGKNDGDKIFGGLIAEEVDAAGLTEFVVYDEEGKPDALHYGNMAGLFVKAIQELSAKNDALEARIAAVEGIA